MKPATSSPTSAADPWVEVSAALLPATHAAALAPLRDRPEVRVFPGGDSLWVRFPAGWPEFVRCLLPVPGAAFFVPRSGCWFRFGSRLPTADVPPDGEGEAVAAVVGPGPIEPVFPADEALAPLVLGIVRGGSPWPATALIGATADLRRWAETATTAELAAVTAARSHARAILLGSRLPSIPGAIRLWGDDLLVPVGFRPEPDLAPAAIREAVGAGADELVVLDDRGAEIIPRAAFESLTRAGIRLALAEGAR
jgi:hypothetical protein